jgi:TM2 domain-containing membrane protein YozV
MKCGYHPANTATTRCTACHRALCPACDHRIKGYPYCQDCIVAGIESLPRGAAAGRGSSSQTEEKSPVVALLLGLIPGLGAAYNGQNIKALMHFVIVVGLWTLADIFGMPLELTFGLGGAAFYFYSLYDAFQSSQRLRMGGDLIEEDERLKAFLQRRMNIFGGLLVGIGGLAILNIAFPHLIDRYWPLLLIVAGIHLIWSYRRNIREPQMKSVYRTPPPSVIPSGFDRNTSEFARAEHRAER